MPNPDINSYKVAHKLLMLPESTWPALIGEEKAERLKNLILSSSSPEGRLSGFWGDIGSGISNVAGSIASGAGSFASGVGGKIGDITAGTADLVKDLGVGTKDAIVGTYDFINPYNEQGLHLDALIDDSMDSVADSVTTSPTEAAGGQVLPEALSEVAPSGTVGEIVNSSQGINWLDKVADAAGSIWDFTKKVGAPLAGSWLKYSMSKDAIESKVKEGQSRQNAMNSEEAKQQRQEKVEKLSAYVSKYWSQLRSMGFSDPKKAAAALLKATGGKVPDMSNPPSYYLQTGGSGISTGVGANAEITNFLKEYWWAVALGGVALFLYMRE